ncbi:hypothetical protein [Rheinheimera sp.]
MNKVEISKKTIEGTKAERYFQAKRGKQKSAKRILDYKKSDRVQGILD